MKAAGVGLVRTAFSLSTAKTQAASPYDWTSFDSIVAKAAEHRIELLPVVYGAPAWTPGGLGSMLGNPNRSAWRDYLTALVNRYGTDGEFWSEHPEIAYRPVTDWQVWNEPNSFVNWVDPDPREYGRFLARSAKAIRAADPNAQIVSAGVVSAPINSSAETGAKYLRRMLRSRAAARAADIIAVHPYTKTVGMAKRLIRETREVMDRAGLRRTPIWVTEIGWGSTGPVRPGSSRQAGAAGSLGRWAMTRTRQRKSMRSAFEMALKQRKRLGIGRMVWYQWQDGDDGACGWCATSGLLNRKGREKRLLSVFSRIARR